MKRKIIGFWLLLALVSATVMFNSCGKDEPIEVTAIRLDTLKLTLAIDEEYTLIATVTPDNAADTTVTWTSDDNSKATVVDGKVTAKAVGEAKITAKAGEQTATCVVTVYEPLITIDVIAIRLDTLTLSLAIGEEYTLIATVTPDNATDPTVTWTSDDNSKATVVDGKVTAKAVGEAKITAKAGDQTATCVITVYEPDEGVIINGVKWATRNVDAPGTFAANPEDPGMFYQWNHKKAWPATGEVTGWDSSNPTGETWEKENDPSPAGWRVPTLAETQKLLDTDNVTSEWINKNGLIGRKFIDRTNGNSVFLPASGYRSDEGVFYHAGNYGFYWSNTAYETSNAYYLIFYSGSAYWGNKYNRTFGFSVRPVAE